MRTYTMKKVNGAPDWSEIPVMPIDNLLWTDSIDITAQAQLCWDAENIYIRQEAVEPHIRREGTGLLARVCEDSCLEFFLRPTDRLEYFNFEWNPNLALWLGYGRERDTQARLLVPDAEELFDAKVEMTPKGWVLTYRVPFAFIRRFFPEFRVTEGLQIRGNCYKCGDETVKPHYLAWNPIVNDTPAFHVPTQFGCLIFGGE